MSRTVGILFVTWLCIFSVSEAEFGASCSVNDSSNCTATSESCIEGSCNCSNGYSYTGNECKSSAITVSLSLSSNSVLYGSEVTLTASIKSDVPVSIIKWQKVSSDSTTSYLDTDLDKYNQTGDVGTGTVKLTIKGLNFQDKGNYRVEVTNNAGTKKTSDPLSIDVTGGTITVSLSTISSSVLYGSEVTLTASVSSDLPISNIIWQKVSGDTTSNLNTNLTKYNLTGDVALGTGTVKLTIKDLNFQDEGNYRVEVTNNAGTKKTSDPLSIDVTGGTISIVLSLSLNSVLYGSEVTLTASITSDVLVSNIIWQRVSGDTTSNLNTNLTKYNLTGDVALGTGTVKLTIKGLNFQDEGNYQVEVTNNAGTKENSNQVSINVTGVLTVTTGADVTGRFGGSVTIDCNVTGPEVSNIQWIKYTNNNPSNIEINNNTYSGGLVTSAALTINKLVETDAAQYQCTASNPGGVYNSVTRATVTVKYGQFDESCTSIERCDLSENLECSPNKCLCNSAYYHKDKECFQKSGLAPTIKDLITTTDQFSVSWDNPSTHHELVSAYEVTWRVASSSAGSSGQLSRTKNQYTSPSNLTSGQLYLVNVISHADLTEPTQSIVVTSGDRNMRTVPSAPGRIIRDESNFTHNNLQIKWTAPVNTVVTKYEITLNGTTYNTMNDDDPIYQFNGKVFIPGKSYDISIVTVSGTMSDIVKKSPEHRESIRTTPTKPNPPTNLQCPQSPLDISLQISWTAPTEPNGLIYRYQIHVSSGNLSQIFTTSNETYKNVENLSPEQMYTFTVRTINDALDNTSEPSQPLNCTTKAGVSTAPTNLNIDGIQSRGFRIRFNRPENVSGVLAAYKIVIISEGGNCVQQILVHGHCSICMSTVGCPSPINYTVPDIINNDVSYTASGLDPYTQYMVKVVAINGKGEGHPVNETVTTYEEVPPQPEQITARNYQSTSLLLSWTLPDPSPGNTTYTIYTHEGNDDKGTSFFMKKSTKVYGFDTKTLSVKGLEEYWPYKFKVTAATVKGDNTSDFSSVFRTKQAAPGQVLNLKVQKKGSDYRSAYVSWSPPALKNHNGVLKSYLFSVNHTGTMEEEEIPVLLTQDTVEKKIHVIPEAVYIIKVVLENNENMTSERSMQSYEAPAGPPPVTNIKPITTTQEEHKPTTNTIPLNVNTTYFNNDTNGIQVFGGIAVCAELKYEDVGQSTIKSVWKSLPNWHKAKKQGFPLYRVTNDTFLDTALSGDSRKKRSTTTSTLPFIIGEDITCSSLNEDVYCNGPLNPGTSYIVIIFACTNGGCTYYKTAEPYTTAKKIEKPQDIPIGLIAGVVVAVVVVVVIVGVAFVVVKRRNRLGETKQYTKGIDNPTSLDEPVPKNIPRKRPIKLKELSDKVAEKHKDSNLHFAREYEDLKALSPKHPAETSELDNNKLKNRYVNILPFDHSRVKLMLTEDDDPSTDFINANYLPGYKSQREYIATQGPIPGTIDDFWRMIWEQNVSIIVMLTLCKEEGRVKCEMYWPENIHEPKQYGDLVVETVSNSTVNFYEFRIFKIKLGDTTRSVKHFHFLQWKDFSANVQNDVMIDFIKNVRNHIRPPDMNGPVVVHCSAGVGRTGTYCALDHLFQFVDEHDLDESIDIFDLVMNLRERRMFMVQTEQQYIFIHDCLKDYLEKKLAKDECLYENQAFVADDEPVEESLYQNYSNQRTDL